MKTATTEARTDIDALCIDTIRVLSMDAVEAANSGHPGAPMGLAAATYALWTRVMKHDPTDPTWPDRDRFVLSAGHASILLYVMLHLTGYDVSTDDLRNFRRLGSKTPGHPEHGLTPGVETTTGPLGQGVANAVGMAIAERIRSERLNMPGHQIVDHRTFAICSDGDLMEGIASEACSLAGHLGLSKLTLLYDDNGISIDGSTTLAFGEDVRSRFAAYGWHTIGVDGSDANAVEEALREAAMAHDRPTLIALRTHIAHGAPTKQDSAAAHGAPLGAAEIDAIKSAIGWTHPPFEVPAAVRDRMGSCVEAGRAAHANWSKAFADYSAEHPARSAEFSTPTRTPSVTLPTPTSDVSTRVAGGSVLASLWDAMPSLVGGSADLSESTCVMPPAAVPFTRSKAGRYLHFGVREHAMGGVLNGIALHGGLRPFGSTFLVFSDYMRPSIRLAALMRLPVIYVFTHDSIGLGEDGPTHQPIEHLAALRSIPGLTVIRPADASETAEAWASALRSVGPTALVLTRQTTPRLDRTRASRPDASAGAYVLEDDADPQLILIASGSEVGVAVGAATLLRADDLRIRVVSMPSWELFSERSARERDNVLPPTVRARVSIEAASTFGWTKWIGEQGASVGIDRFGASAPGSVLMATFGFTPDVVADVARRTLAGLKAL